jgi:hypothetical protein
VSPVKYEMGFYIPEDGVLHIADVEQCRMLNSVSIIEAYYGAPRDDGAVPLTAGEARRGRNADAEEAVVIIYCPSLWGFKKYWYNV